MKTGFYKRSKPPLEILRGFSLDNAERQGDFLEVASGVTILSGQVCFKSWSSDDNKYFWDLGCTARPDSLTPYLAVEDSDHPNYTGSGVLHAISCADTRLVQTAFFESGTYNVGDALTYIANGSSGEGNVKLATEDTDVIIGYVERPRRPTTSIPSAAADYELGTRDIAAELEYDGATTTDVLVWTTAWTGSIFFATGQSSTPIA